MVHIISGPNQGFASRFIDARTQAKLTQEQLADMVGIARRNIWMYEKGDQVPKPDKMEALATAMKCNHYWLATGKNQETHEYLAAQSANAADLLPKVASLYIEDWAGFDSTLQFNPPFRRDNGTTADQYVHWVAKKFAPYRAVRFPGGYIECPEFPSGSVLILNTAPVSENTLTNGDVVVFKDIDEGVNTPGLRRFVREASTGKSHLLAIDGNFPALDFDDKKWRVLGVVVAQFFMRK
jgi:transcriptional regulator with XRE-family HTH domain